MRFISSSSSFYYLALGIIFNHQLITNADILHSRGLHHTISHKQLSKTLLKRSNEPIKPPTVLPTVGIKYAEDYQLSQTLAGETFFDGFVFINRWDNTTHGATYYVDKREANNKNLAYLDPHGRAIIAVDSKTDLSNDTNPPVVLNTTDGNYTVNYNGLRKSVRLESKRRYPAGSLIIADFDHLPFGCATWPAFWMFGEDWPNNGEVDIFEGWNDNTKNRMALHTNANCSHDPSGIQTGKVEQETCDYTVAYNAGCGVEDQSTNFYGQRFAELKGGVFATLFTDSEITIWQWNRQEIPADVTSNQPQPKSWGKPVATWLSGKSCHLPSFFGPQNLVFTITTCGDADKNTYAQGKCPGDCFERLQTGKNFVNAYFAVNSIKIYKAPSCDSTSLSSPLPNPFTVLNSTTPISVIKPKA